MSEFLFDTSDCVFSQQLFIRFTGFTYFCAFWSLFVQVLGLYGSQGILPAEKLLSNLKDYYQIKNLYLKIPTLFWLGVSDLSLRIFSALGMIASMLVILDYFSVFFLVVLWILYLSFQNIGSVFLSFQWDTLLLEVGFLTIFFSIQSPPPSLLLIALWVLLFRFMFSSGLVKLISGCPEWRMIKALTYHYETQPIPNRIAYYMQQLPRWFSKISEISIYFFELAVPFLIFGNSTTRLVAFILLVFFQVLIMLTGNYAFFNVLSIALCIPLLDNASLVWFSNAFLNRTEIGNPFLTLLLNLIGGVFIIMNILRFYGLFSTSLSLHGFLDKLSAYYINNDYGLFANMTTSRDEIVIEGSDDGINWKVYEFKWKPGDLFTPPKQVAPYHPRLDWQMWFAALGSFRNNQWFQNFLVCLLEGSPAVIKLLKINPFPDQPPKYIRSFLYRYHFTDLQTKEATGQWWTRTMQRPYTPTFSLKSGPN